MQKEIKKYIRIEEDHHEKCNEYSHK